MLTKEQLDAIRSRNDEAEARILVAGFLGAYTHVWNSQKDVGPLLQEITDLNAHISRLMNGHE